MEGTKDFHMRRSTAGPGDGPCTEGCAKTQGQRSRVLAAAYDCRGAMDTRRAMEALVCALKFEFEVAG